MAAVPAKSVNLIMPTCSVNMAAAVIQRALTETVSEMGLSALKPKQIEAVLAFLDGKDTFVSLPTGYGKSIIYGVLPLVFDKLRGDK